LTRPKRLKLAAATPAAAVQQVDLRKPRRDIRGILPPGATESGVRILLKMG
jgi:hypothetical protein